MNGKDIYEIVNNIQVSTALVLIAISLVYIAVRLSERKHPRS